MKQSVVFFEVADFPLIQERLGGHDTPLIWTADFMLDTSADGSDKYVLGEINCSCVGFTSHLDSGIQETVSDEIVRVVSAAAGVAPTPQIKNG